MTHLFLVVWIASGWCSELTGYCEKHIESKIVNLKEVKEEVIKHFPYQQDNGDYVKLFDLKTGKEIKISSDIKLEIPNEN